MHNETVETLIGAIVIAVAVIFVVYMYQTTGSTMGGYELTAKMNRVDGVAVGTDVRLAGVKVGNVRSLDLGPDYLVTVHMDITNRDVKVPDDSSLMVTSSGLLGSSYLSIAPGGSDKMLGPGGVIKNTQGAIDMMGLINKFVNSGSSNSNSSNPAPAQP